MIKKNLLLSIVLLLFTLTFFAQQVNNEYVPIDLDAYEDYFDKINDIEIDKVKGKYARKVRKIYKKYTKWRLESLKDSNFVFNAQIDSHVNTILQEIYRANPQIDTSDFRFFINNSIVPNAACYGDGMFELNLGLLNTVKSDGELAFIICHEIAHKLLRHTAKKIHKAVYTLNSKSTKDKVKEIRKKKYGKTRAALSVIDELSINLLEYSQDVESEADILGFEMFAKTKYSKGEAISSLLRLKNMDDMVFYQSVNVDSVFNFKTYPFQAEWLKSESSIFNSEKVIDEFTMVSDTIKTHPEIAFRIEQLKSMFDISTTSTVQNDHLKTLHAVSNEVSIKATEDFKQIDLTIYQLVNKKKNGVISGGYYYAAMANILKVLYNAKKEHEFGKYIPAPNNFSDEKELNKIRLFLYHLELHDIKSMGKAFCETNEKFAKDKPIFIEAQTFFNNI